MSPASATCLALSELLPAASRSNLSLSRSDALRADSAERNGANSRVQLDPRLVGGGGWAELTAKGKDHAHKGQQGTRYTYLVLLRLTPPSLGGAPPVGPPGAPTPQQRRPGGQSPRSGRPATAAAHPPPPCSTPGPFAPPASLSPGGPRPHFAPLSRHALWTQASSTVPLYIAAPTAARHAARVAPATWRPNSRGAAANKTSEADELRNEQRMQTPRNNSTRLKRQETYQTQREHAVVDGRGPPQQLLRRPNLPLRPFLHGPQTRGELSLVVKVGIRRVRNSDQRPRR